MNELGEHACHRRHRGRIEHHGSETAVGPTSHVLDRRGNIEDVEAEVRGDSPACGRWLRHDHVRTSPPRDVGHQQPHRPAAHDDHEATQERRHSSHDMYRHGDGLGKRRDVLGYDVQPLLRDRDTPRKGTVAVDADEPKPGTCVGGADITGGARSAGQQGIDQHDPAGQPARLRHVRELVADGERECSPGVAAIDDVQVGTAEPGEPCPNDDLAVDGGGVRHIAPTEPAGPHEQQCAIHVPITCSGAQGFIG